MRSLSQICLVSIILFMILQVLLTSGVHGLLETSTVASDFQWTYFPEPMIYCEGEDAKFLWRYQSVNYTVGGKTWFKNIDTNAKRIAYWNKNEGFVLETNYKDRVERIGEDGLLLKRVTPEDNEVYSLIVSFPIRSERDPRQSVNLTVYEPPLEGCCKPTIRRLENGTGLQGDLHTQACGTQPFHLKWKNASGTKANGDILFFDSTEVTGTFTVCVTGATVEKCFRGRHESLCHEEHIEKKSEVPITKEQDLALVAGLTTLATIVALAVIVVLIIALNWRRIQKFRNRNRNWKKVRASGKYNNDVQMLQSLILSDEDKMDKATMEISHILYLTYTNRKELELQKINTAEIALENSEIQYILMENQQTKVSNPSYVQCLYHENRLLKLLILQGDLGTGKTTWCRKFVKTWCDVRAWQDQGISIRNKSESIQTLKSFPLLFLVSLRNVKKEQNFKDIIKQQCMMGRDTQNGQFYDNLDTLMNKRPEKLIFIIHGADEADTDVSILNEIISKTKNSLTILTCRDWEPLQSKYGIREQENRPMAKMSLKHIDKQNLELYATSILDDYNYPKDAFSEFMKLIKRNELEKLMEKAYFIEPLINIWHKSGSLPSDEADVCLCLIEDNLKERREQLKEYATLKLDLDVARFIPKVMGKIFIIEYGKVLCGLGEVAHRCLQNRGSNDIFLEEELMKCTKISDNRLIKICVAAKLVSTAPVGVMDTVKKLCFQDTTMQCFLAAFYLACEMKSHGKNEQSGNSELIIQAFLTSLAPHLCQKS